VLGYRAAFTYPSRERLPKLSVRTLIATNPTDPLHEFTEEAASLAPPATAATIPGGYKEAAARYLQFLAEGG
jgi:hypothetical protein